MLRHDLRRALLSPRTLFVALAYGVLLSLGATETWNDSAAYQFAFSYKTGFYILFYLCAVLPYGCGYLEDRLSGYWRFLQTRCSSTPLLRLQGPGHGPLRRAGGSGRVLSLCGHSAAAIPGGQRLPGGLQRV